MDPNACLERILNAIADKDFQEAIEAADDLLGWKNSGGFRPAAQSCPVVIYPKLMTKLHEINEWLGQR